MVADIEMADRSHDDPDYMEDAKYDRQQQSVKMLNMIEDNSHYFADYNELMQDNPTEQQEGNAPEQ